MNNNPVEHFGESPADIIEEFRNKVGLLMGARAIFQEQENAFLADAPYYIKALRMERGISQEALAQAVGVDDTYISKVENAKVAVTYELLRKIIFYMQESG